MKVPKIRLKLSRLIKDQVLIEAGYRCAVPTCRNILAIDLHHMVEVSQGGGNSIGNLLALCPTCHALFHRGEYTRDAIYAWKGVLVALSQAFDRDSIDLLLFLSMPNAAANLRVDGNGVLRFSKLLSAGLAQFSLWLQNGPLVMYKINLTEKGKHFVDAWKSGDRSSVEASLR